MARSQTGASRRTRRVNRAQGTVISIQDTIASDQSAAAETFELAQAFPDVRKVAIRDAMASFASASIFAVSILNAHQAHLAKLFATRGADRFGDPAMIDSESGLPVADAALAQLDCTLEFLNAGGDHAT